MNNNVNIKDGNHSLRSYSIKLKIAKMLIWLAITLLIIATTLVIIKILKSDKEVKSNETNTELGGIISGIIGDVFEGTFKKIFKFFLIGSLIIILLLYIFPLIFVRKTNTLFVWSIVWIILDSICFLFFLIYISKFLWYEILIWIINILLIYAGTIMLIVYCKKLNNIEEVMNIKPKLTAIN